MGPFAYLPDPLSLPFRISTDIQRPSPMGILSGGKNVHVTLVRFRHKRMATAGHVKAQNYVVRLRKVVIDVKWAVNPWYHMAMACLFISFSFFEIFF